MRKAKLRACRGFGGFVGCYHVGVSILIATCSAAGAAAEASDELATFEYSRDPSAVVLHVATTSVRADLTYSMMVFGDGRVEVERGRASEHERYEFRLEPAKLEELLGTAVSHGLAEFDETRIYAEQKRSTGQVESYIEDGQIVEVTLSLSRFQRGDWSVDNFRKTIRVNTPSIAMRRYPEVEEFRGLDALARFAQEAHLWPGSVRR